MESLSLRPPPPALPDPARIFFEDLGRRVAGPLVGAMVQWMIGQVRARRPEILLFLGRDGRIIHKVWNLTCPADLRALPTRYVLASRRALRMATLTRIDGAFHRLLTHHAEGLPFEHLFQALNLPLDQIEAAIRAHAAVSPRAPYRREEAAVAGQVLHLLGPAIQKRSAEERQAYLNYLDTLGISEARHVGVVDIGWHGSLQASLGQLLRSRHPETVTSGYYLGLFAGSSHWSGAQDQMEACLVQDGQPAYIARELTECVELVEFMFSSNEAGLICFEQPGPGASVPVFMEDLRSPYQKAALNALEIGLLEAAGGEPRSIQEAYRTLHRLAFQPTIREVRFLGRLQARRGFGKAGLLQPFAVPGNPVLNLVHWHRLYRSFKESLWRHGYWAALSKPERSLLRLISPIGTRPFVRVGGPGN